MENARQQLRILDALENNPAYRDSGITLEQRIQQKQAEYGDGLTDEEALEEVICDTIPVILSDESVLKDLVRTDRTLAGQIRDFFTDFYNTILNQLDRVIYDGNRMEAAALAGDIDTILTIADLFNAALGETVDSRRGETTYSAKRGYTSRSLADMTEAQYNRYGWATANNVLSKGEQARFLALIGRKQAGEVFQTPDGKRYAFIVESDSGTDSILILSDGKYNNPSIDIVIRSSSMDGDQLAETWRYALEFFKDIGDYEAIKGLLEEKYIEVYSIQDFGGNGPDKGVRGGGSSVKSPL